MRSSRVLIAEDESIIRIGLCRILEDAGYQVVAAPDGRTAVKLARQTGPDLVILDIKMPNLDGLETARRIYGHRPVPIVILTAYGDHELVREAADLPIMAYLIKPVNEKELLATSKKIQKAVPKEELQLLTPSVHGLIEALEHDDLIDQLKHVGYRTGFLAAGSLTDAIEGLRALHGIKKGPLEALPGAGLLMAFVFSRDHIELRKRFGQK